MEMERVAVRPDGYNSTSPDNHAVAGNDRQLKVYPSGLTALMLQLHKGLCQESDTGV
jgi:hypothetical protein